MLPWLVVYMIGIITCYAASLIIFARDIAIGIVNIECLVPLTGGVIFNFIWILAKSAYSDIKLEARTSDIGLNPMQPMLPK